MSTAPSIASVPSISPTSEFKKSMRRFAASLVVALSVLAIGGFGLIVAVNFAELSASWMLGFGGAIGLLLVVTALYWASHPTSGKVGGTAVGIITLVLSMIGYNAIMPIDEFNAGDFGFGLLDICLILASAGIIYVFAGRKTR